MLCDWLLPSQLKFCSKLFINDFEHDLIMGENSMASSQWASDVVGAGDGSP